MSPQNFLPLNDLFLVDCSVYVQGKPEDKPGDRIAWDLENKFRR